MAAMAQDQPSLQRLLAIDKDFSSFDEQLNQASQILGRPEETKELAELGNVPCFRANPRAEWVLRWLLGKLKSDTARASAGAWQLLRHVAVGLPISISAKHLNASGFLSILERTLQENFVSPSGTQHDAVNAQEVISEPSATVTEPRASRKRKRHESNAGERASSKRPALEPVELRNLFDAVSAALVAIASLGFGNTEGNDSSEAELIKSTLRTNTVQAARLLKLWLESIHYLIVSRPQPTDEASTVGPLLDKMLQIWNSSFPETANGSPAEQFSENCLVPAVVLLSDLASPAPHVESQVVNILEALLARHVFIPCRGTFFTETEGRKVVGKSEELELRRMLVPLRSAIGGTGESGFSAASTELSKFASMGPSTYALLHAAGSLVDIAIRCSQRSTPKKRLDEAPWLQHVFLVICECIGTPIIQRRPAQVETDRKVVLEQMLGTLQRRSVSLEAEILETIVRSYSGIMNSQDGSKTIDLQLVARVLAYDPTIFLDSSKSQDNEPSLADALFDAITRLSVRANNTTEWDTLKNSVVVPLLKAHANSRELEGFLSRWLFQLKSTEADTSIWVDEGLGVALRDLLESSLTPRQLFELFNEHWRWITASAVTLSGDEKASLVIVDALIGALRSDDTIASLTSVLESLQKELLLGSNVISKDRATAARAFRVIYSIHVLLRPYRKSEEKRNFGVTFFKWAETQNILNAVKEATQRSEALRMGQEAFMLIATLCSDFLELSDFKGHAQSLFISSLFAAALFRSNDAVRDHISSGQEWDSVDHPNDQATVLDSFTLQAAATLIKFHGLFPLIPVESLEKFIRLLYWYAFGDYSEKYRSPNLRHGVTYLLIFEAVSDILLTSRNEHKDLLFSIVFEPLDPGTKLGKSRDLRKLLCEFSEAQYLRMALTILNRKHREQVLDRVCEMHCSSSKKRSDPETQFRQLSLMVKLMGVPNATSQLATDPDTLWNIACSAQHGSPHPDLLRLLEELVRLTLEDAIAVKTQPRGEQFLKGFRKTMQRVVKDTKTLKDRTAELVCFKSALTTLKKANALGDEEDTYKIMKRYLRALDNDIENLLPGELQATFNGDLVFVRAVLDAVADLPTQGLEHDVAFLSIESKLQKCTRGQQTFATNASQAEMSVWVSLSRAAANVSIADDSRYFGQMVGRLWSSELSIEDRHIVMKTSKKAAASLGPGRRAQLLSSLISTQNHETPSAETLFLVNVLVPSLQDAPTVKGDAAKRDLLGLGGHLASNLPNVQSFGDLQVMSNCIDTILREKQWLVTQWAVENLINSLCKLSSSSGPALPANYADAIYTRICGTTHLVISLHRTRLGGRYHVLMPLLQNLLRCLFTPETKQGVANSSQPPWLNPRIKPLTSAHAASFARLVTTLCNPTVSAVSKHRPRATLVDETKKAREYAGQYVPAIIVQFCACALHGRISPEMRAALMPALYACADVVGIEALRAMNAGMDASARAIWRGVYSDWKKFGKWEGR